MHVPAHDVAIMSKVVAKLERVPSQPGLPNELDDATVHHENTSTSALQPYRNQELPSMSYSKYVVASDTQTLQVF